MNSNSGNYQAFLEKRSALLSIIDQQLVLLSTLNIQTEVETVQQIKNRLSTDSFKVLVLGEFKRGKSTFINALLGRKILPAYPIPCTAIINEVKWGSTPNALLYLRASEDNARQELVKTPVEDIEKYVVIPLDEDKAKYISPYEKVEIFYPIELCRNGVEIIDSPGLNESPIRSAVTEEYLPIVDAVVFVLSCEHLASMSEIDFIKKRLSFYSHDELFFVCNRFDQIEEEERERVKKYALQKFSPLTKLGEDGIFFVSAYEALQGRLKQKPEKVARSGIPNFEQKMERFLTESSGRLKVLEPARNLLVLIEKAQDVVPQQKAMLQTNREALEKLYRDAQQPLEKLELRRKQIATSISQFRQDIENLVRDEAYRFYSSLPEKVDAWVKEVEIQSRIDLKKVNPLNLDKSVTQQVEPIIQEISKYLADKVESEFIPWQTKEVQPFVNSRLETLKDSIDAKTAEFIREVDELRSRLASSEGTNLSKEAMSGLRRILSVAGGRQHENLSWMKAVFGSGSEKTTGIIVKTVVLATSITAAGAGVAMTLAVPILAIVGPLVVGMALAGGELDRANRRVEDEIRAAASRNFAEELRKSSSQQAIEFAKDVREKLKGIGEVLDQGLSKEIQSVRDQVESVLRKKNEGQASVDQQVRELATVSEKLKLLKGELSNLIRELESSQ